MQVGVKNAYLEFTQIEKKMLACFISACLYRYTCLKTKLKSILEFFNYGVFNSVDQEHIYDGEGELRSLQPPTEFQINLKAFW